MALDAENSSPTSKAPPQAIILAAGKGTRMAADVADLANQSADQDAVAPPKVLYPVADKPMVWWVVQACKQAGVSRCILVIGYEGQQVRDALAGESDCIFVEQTEQLGTGHAADMAKPLFADQPNCDVFVLAGDGPLIRPKTLTQVLNVHQTAGATATLATAVIDDPTGYGRVIRDEQGGLDAIVEHKDANEQQLAVKEINPSYYCFDADKLFDALSRVGNDNSQGEYYITDVPGMMKREGNIVSVVDAVPADDVHSVNNPQQLAVVDAIMRARLNKQSDVSEQSKPVTATNDVENQA
jgi:bifunctional UDP-N-acetylglucosamine pyrophosphorylase / glucosamine-1-phosphate N-acetyltransferase